MKPIAIDISSLEIDDETSLYLAHEGGFIPEYQYEYLKEGIETQGYCVIRGSNQWIKDLYDYVQLNTYST